LRALFSKSVARRVRKVVWSKHKTKSKDMKGGRGALGDRRDAKGERKGTMEGGETATPAFWGAGTLWKKSYSHAKPKKTVVQIIREEERKSPKTTLGVGRRWKKLDTTQWKREGTRGIKKKEERQRWRRSQQTKIGCQVIQGFCLRESKIKRITAYHGLKNTD